MCHESTGLAYDRPLSVEDVSLIAAHYPRLASTTVTAVYQAITDRHWPQPAVLIAVLEMIDRAKRHDNGYYPYPTMPFSAMDLKTDERVQTDGMYAFHSVFESMALAQRNLKLLDDVLRQQVDQQLVLFCDCGCSIVPADTDPFATDWYQEINDLRSWAESEGTPVIRVSDFAAAEWQQRQDEHGLDMGPAELASYDRMYAILQSLPARSDRPKTRPAPGFVNKLVQPA